MLQVVSLVVYALLYDITPGNFVAMPRFSETSCHACVCTHACIICMYVWGLHVIADFL